MATRLRSPPRPRSDRPGPWPTSERTRATGAQPESLRCELGADRGLEGGFSFPTSGGCPHPRGHTWGSARGALPVGWAPLRHLGDAGVAHGGSARPSLLCPGLAVPTDRCLNHFSQAWWAVFSDDGFPTKPEGQTPPHPVLLWFSVQIGQHWKGAGLGERCAPDASPARTAESALPRLPPPRCPAWPWQLLVG